MGLSIDPEIARLAAEVAALAHETETEAVRRALEERRNRLRAGTTREGRRNIQEYLEKYIWPTIPPDKLGVSISREEEDEILGYGPNGYCE